MYKLPDDILRKINQDYSFPENEEIIILLSEVYMQFANVRVLIPAIRGIIYLAEKDAEKIREFCIPYLKNEPRDIILAAEDAAGNPGHYFNIPFDQM